MLSSSLARLGGGSHSLLTIDLRDQPTEAGRADGIQPRTIEVLKNMQPLGNDLIARSSASYERSFWYPTKDGTGLQRSRRVQSTPTYLDIEDNCTLGLQQGLIEQGFLRDMDVHGCNVLRPWAFQSFDIASDNEEYPIRVTLQNAENQAVEIVRAKYLVGCDGGRSGVRQFLEKHHGFEMKGEWVDTLWGAIDAGAQITTFSTLAPTDDSDDQVVKSDFPDLRKIAAIHSKHHGGNGLHPCASQLHSWSINLFSHR
ncbi:hypothetical protein BS47DRAFT_728146 [Hydnum rufescens UP504]|uniref:FAD-binding domain-containing protein n=1 Tax=Hydnum rufescens UP504 TaxID=1448309 RepID=A0A9P6B1G7_9AGAM|nr:hypothetical protein BS47DRAFT_728146 [Hydnum rufescens UP504]